MTTTHEIKSHEELELDVEYTFQRGTPGRLSGPPEHCYPPEPDEIEIVKVTFRGIDITAKLTADEIDKIAGSIDHEDDDEPDTDWRADQAREERVGL